MDAPVTVRTIDIVYTRKVIHVAIKDILKNLNYQIRSHYYPDEFQHNQPDIVKSEFLLFATASLSKDELDSLNDFHARTKDTLILVACLESTSEQILSLIQAGVRGVICSDDEFHLLPESIEALQRGELWCPRSVLQQILENLDESARMGKSGRDLKDLLSEREKEILSLIVKGFKNKEIAENLCISYSTVINHVHNIYRKLEVNNRAGAIRFAVNNSLLS